MFRGLGFRGLGFRAQSNYALANSLSPMYGPSYSRVCRFWDVRQASECRVCLDFESFAGFFG